MIAWITDPLGDDRSAALGRLGGKAVGLAEMVQLLDLPVPPAFVITTDVCRSYLSTGWPEGLDDRIAHALDELGRTTGRSFAGVEKPLLVSVRSGAPVSMPGMMDTVLNVGINEEIATALSSESGSEAFGSDTLDRFRTQYEATVGSVPPADPYLQVRGAVEAVLRSWNSERAITFREAEGIDGNLGTAVVVQAMVFGNLNDQSGTGVLFTRDPASGVDVPYGDYLVRAQGEDVVSGAHDVGGLTEFAAAMPELHAKLIRIGRRLEHHYRDMCDIEFTVDSGELYILQTRIGRRSPEAAVRMAVQMAQDPEFPLTRGEAAQRVDRKTRDKVAEMASVNDGVPPIATGIAASPGVGRGVLSTDPDEAAELARADKPVVLARAETSPADVHGMVGAAGLVTALGGAASHAAVVARSWGIPAVTGVRAMEVTPHGIVVEGRRLPTGTVVTIDGTTGRLFEGNLIGAHGRDVPELRDISQWAAETIAERSGTPWEPESNARDIGRLDVFRTVALKGNAGSEVIADSLRTDRAKVDAILEQVGDLVTSNVLGVALTSEARAWLAAALSEERAGIDRAGFNQLYERFLAVNTDFKLLVTEWQTGDQDDAAFTATSGALRALDSAVAPMLAESIRLVPRLGHFAPRFGAAMEAFANGDVSMLASPLKDSYHTVWFEYHEELIHLGGRDRAEEEAAEGD
ncbi:MAG: pyruvate, phosphate dikinase [Actinomycetota bacterium]